MTLLLEALGARTDLARPWFTLHGEDARVLDARTGAELLGRARAIAAHLRLERRLEPGDRAILVYLPSLHFVDAFLGCLLAGVVPVPLPPPDPSGHDLGPLRRVAESCRARVLLTESTYDRARFLGRLKSRVSLKTPPAWPDLPWVVTDRVGVREANAEGVAKRRPGGKVQAAAPPFAAAAGDVALLQYTSGSTGDPKGVRITHGNLAHQLELNRSLLGMGPSSRLGFWVPQFHDFGLVSGICSVLHGNGTAAILSPLTFLRRPASWMALLSREACTHTAAPNFAFDLVVRKTSPEERRALDLRALEVVMSAAEPVRPETLDRFLEAFAPCGLRREALCPAYGLAEHTVGVTMGGRVRATIEGGLVASGCGRPPDGVILRIVNPDTRAEAAPGETGEIWVDSPSKADGYEGRPDLTAEVFQATLAEPDGRTYLRTGDLGVLVEGEVVVTGRLKDTILLRGRNVYPNDVEEAARTAHPAIRPGGVAAFGLAAGTGTEDLVLFVELAEGNAPPTSVAASVRAAVSAALLGVHVDTVVLGRRGLVPKTTSGKVRRGACRERMLEPGFARRAEVVAVLGEAAPEERGAATGPLARSTDSPTRPEPSVLEEGAAGGEGPIPRSKAPATGVTAEDLARVAAKVLGRPVDREHHDVPLRELGMSSLQLVAFCAAVEAELGWPLPPARLFEAPTLLALASGLDGAAPARFPPAPSAPSAGDLSPIAVVGLACRFPGGLDDPDALWDAFLRGAPPAGWGALRSPPGPPAAARLEVEAFDPAVFGIRDAEARSLAPEQRLALELAWEALESAGLAPDRFQGARCGVFLASSPVEYGLQTLYGAEPDAWSALGSMPSVVAGRVSYTLGLVGPAMVVDTACSSSLVAVHLAVQALRRGECDWALAGGVNVTLRDEGTEALSRLGMLSPTRRCFSFDERADGYARADGAGLVLLRRAQDVPAGARVFATVLASAVNQDGRGNGLSAPNPAQQRAVIRAAWAGIPGACGFVEANGTGTPLGDALELAALDGAFADMRGGPSEPPPPPGIMGGPSETLHVSSGKGNLSHTEAAAGIAAFLRAVLAVHHGVIPPQSDRGTPTPRFDWARSRLRVPAEPVPFPAPRLAGVSAFGLSGTNAHVVIGEAHAEPPPARRVPRHHALVVSAHSQPALAARTRALVERLLDPAADVAQVAAHHAAIQPAHPWRLAITTTDRTDAVCRLAGERGTERPSPRLAVVFPDRDAFVSGDVPRLRELDPRLAAALDEGLGWLAEEAGGSVAEALLLGRRDADHARAGAVVIGHALFRLWAEAGVQPSMVVGRGVGALAAAAVRASPGGEAGPPSASGSAAAVRASPGGEAGSPSASGSAAAATGSLQWREALRRAAEPGSPGAMSSERVTERLAAGADVVLELGPSDTETRAGRLVAPALTWIASTPRGDDGDLVRAAAELHGAGVWLDWRRFTAPWAGPAVAVPGIAWQRRRLWVDRPLTARAIGGSATQAPPVDVAGVGSVFTATFGDDDAWLDDHRVGDAALVPMAWILEWLSAVARTWRPEDAPGVRDLRLSRPAPWSRSLRMQAIVSPSGEVAVHAGDGRAWTQVGTALLAPVEVLPPAPMAPEAVVPAPDERPEESDDARYEALASGGLRYGPWFRRASALRIGRDGGTARVAPGVAPSGLRVHPAVLDAAMHPAAMVLAERGAMLPVGVDSYVALRVPVGPLATTVALSGPSDPSGDVLFDVWLADSEGTAACLRGVRARSLRRERTRVSTLVWRATASEARIGGRFLVVGATDAEVEALVAGGIDARACTPEALGGQGATRIVLLVQGGDPVEAIQSCRAVAQVPGGADVVVVTRGAVATDLDEAADPGGAAVWGFVRSLAREMPEDTWRLRDLGPTMPLDRLGAALGDTPEIVLRDERVLVREDHVEELRAVPGGQSYVACHAGDGLLDHVRLRECPVPAAGPGQVVVGIRAAGLNFRDVLASLGAIPGAAGGVLGGECAGVVVAVGEGVTGVAVSDRVVAMVPGALAAHALADEGDVVRLPDSLGFTEAAALPVAYATAWHALVDLAGLKADERVLIHAAAGGVGLAAVHIARSLGAVVFATAHPSKWAHLRALGVRHVASSRDTSFAESFRAVAGERGMDVVLDALTGELVDAGLGLLRPGGRFVEIGKRDLRDPAEVALRWGVTYLTFDLAELDRERRRELLSRVVRTVAAGELPLLPIRTLPLGAIGQGLRFMAEARHVGKVVLTPPREGGTALVTGGLGALGQRTARWLVERRGVTRLVLVGRTVEGRPLDPALTALGVPIDVVAADVTRKDEMAAVVERCGTSLSYVVHAAGVLDDGPALRQSIARQRQVLAPKLQGALHLDALTAGRDLEAFVVYGSAATLHGSPGQAAYAAANAAMQAVVTGRRARGEGGTYVAWGPWAGGGTAGSREVQKNLRRLGIGFLDPDDALARLDEVLSLDLAHASIVGTGGAAGVTGLTAAFKGAGGEMAARRSGEPWLDRVRALLASLLDLPVAEVAADTLLHDLGVDSLAGIELRARLLAAGGRDLSLAALDPELTVRALAARTEPR